VQPVPPTSVRPQIADRANRHRNARDKRIDLFESVIGTPSNDVFVTMMVEIPFSGENIRGEQVFQMESGDRRGATPKCLRSSHNALAGWHGQRIDLTHLR
jgi:hypothetical protein